MFQDDKLVFIFGGILASVFLKNKLSFVSVCQCCSSHLTSELLFLFSNKDKECVFVSQDPLQDRKQ